ncbi:MAG: glycosyltransferase family 39 protein [Patescibacteria group bacterium]|nr:glycosyltransferase family 39 protein [Patescibacteria group bacterium]
MNKIKTNKLVLYIFLPIIIIAMAFLLWGSAKYNSATTDEPIHILSGYLSLKNADYRFNPEHPFLGKQLSAIPLLFIRPNIDYSEKYFQVASDYYYDSWRETRKMAQDFLYKMGNNADRILFSARSVPIIFALIFALVLFWTAYRYFGILAALCTILLYCFEPNIIAHAQLANTDFWLTIFFFLSVASFAYYLNKPNYKRLILAGFCLGLALAVKFSAIILFIVIPLLWLTHYLLQKNRPKFWHFFSRSLLILIIMAAISFMVVWADYRFDTAKAGSYQQINDAHFYSKALISTQKIADYFKPSQYLKGIILASTNSYAFADRPSYLFGEIKYGGWWYYFPVAYLAKTPLPAILLLFASIIFCFIWRKKLTFKDYVLLIPIVVYLLISLTSKLNIGIRHLLPIYPFILLWLGNFIAELYNKSSRKVIVAIILIILGIWYIYGTVKIFPNYLSYFNEIVGPQNGSKILTDSNIDWGQDLKRLKTWLDSQKISQPILLEYFWTSEDGPSYYGINWQRLEADNANQKGIIAIGVSALQDPRYNWLKKYQPIARVGYSINIYKID